MSARKLFLSILMCAVGALAPALAQADAGKAVIEPGRTKGSVSVDSFNRILAQGAQSVYLIDASSAREFAAGSIKGATNLPLNKIDDQLASLPGDKPIIFFCATGARAGEAYETVRQARKDVEVYFLDAQVSIRQDGSVVVK
jgi:rhodanese-related sulfurtransferase